MQSSSRILPFKQGLTGASPVTDTIYNILANILAFLCQTYDK